MIRWTRTRKPKPPFTPTASSPRLLPPPRLPSKIDRAGPFDTAIGNNMSFPRKL